MTSAPAQPANGAIGSNQDCPDFSINSENWMKFLRAILLFVAAIAVLPFGAAMAVVIECKMDPGFNRWYIAPVIRVEIGEGEMLQGGSAKVSDDLIRATDRKAVFGTVARQSEKQLVVAWELRGAPEDPNRKFGSWRDPQLSMRLAIKRPGYSATLSVNDIASGGQSYRATGTCSAVE